MAHRTQPDAEATYRVIPTEDGAFAVEVSIPETYPTKVSPFATEADAHAWIAEHRRRVQSEGQQGSGFRKRGGRPRKVEQPPRDDE
jgi:hypothetical protein